MRYLVDGNEMKQIDKTTIERTGIPSMVLMERAALAVAEEIRRRVDAPSVLCVCGCGNNGADGLAVARLLTEWGIPASVLALGREEHATEEWRVQRRIVENLAIPVVTNPEPEEYTVIVDALFGIGLGRDLEGSYAEWVERINQSRAWVISVDMPSGISAADGRVLGTAVMADLTVTFGVGKAGLLFYPGALYAGEVLVKQIGFPQRNIEAVRPQLYTFDREDLALLPPRRPDANKGTAGKLLLIAGSRNMAGAAALAARAAYRMGAGLVRVLTPAANREILQILVPEAVLAAWEGTQDMQEKLEASLSWADVVAAGPGIGMDNEAEALMEALSACAGRQKGKSYVLDADALNILSANRQLWKGFSGCSIITPHMGEMARIMGAELSEVQKNRIALAKKAGMEYNVICVLKDARTVVSAGEGACYVNESGSSGMATAGSGDVLCGMIAGCLAMGLERRKAAELGVYLHGLAGDEAKKQKGEHAMTAQDIAEGITAVLLCAEREHGIGKAWIQKWK